MDKVIDDAIKQGNIWKELDLQLQNNMIESKFENEIISDLEFENKLGSIDSDSLIIYVKKAQLFKVYKPERIGDFENDDNTKYRRKENGPVYEVVRDAHPQRLLIVINDDMVEDQIQTIKRHIVKYIDEHVEFEKIAINDLKVYNNDNSTEFLIRSIKFGNIYERDRFIENFTKYMIHENAGIANKIQLRPPIYIDGVRLYDDGQILNSIEHLVTPFVSNAPPQQAPVVINNIIINNNNSTTINNSGTIKTKNKVGVPKKTLQTFYKYIYDTKPKWYVEGKSVNIDIVEKAYRKYFNDNDTTLPIISKKLNDLFSKTSRSNGITKKTLVTFDTLQQLF